MNLGYKDSLSLARKIKSIKELKNEIVVLPDFSSLSSVASILEKSSVSYGSQDVSHFLSGAYTGEVSISSLKDIGCSYALIGHSERRKYFQEDNLVNSKIANVIKNSSITPILCVGETWEERRSGQTIEVIKKQLRLALRALKIKDIIIAYEPVWAIGSGKTVSSAEAVAVHREIIKIVKKMRPKNLKVVYGGSVSVNNFSDFKNIDEISGLLIGGASLNSRDFKLIANNF